MLVREGLVLTGVGLVLGLCLAGLVGQLLGSMLFEVSALDPVVFVVSPIVLAGASLLASYLPARRATLVYPMTALRHE